MSMHVNRQPIRVRGPRDRTISAEQRAFLSNLVKSRGGFVPLKVGARRRYSKPIGPKPLRAKSMLGGKRIYHTPIGPLLPWQQAAKHPHTWRRVYRTRLRNPCLPPARPVVTLVPVSAAMTPRAQAMAIVRNVAALHCVDAADLVGGRRSAALCRVRYVAIAAVRAELEWSTPRIGRLFGGRDHSTILHALRRAKEIEASGDLSPVPAIYAEAA